MSETPSWRIACFFFFKQEGNDWSVPAQESSWGSLELSLITDQLRWTAGLLSISSMEWDSLLQGWDSLFSSMQTPFSVFPLFHCFSIWQKIFFLYRSEKLLFFPPRLLWLRNVCVCDRWHIHWKVKRVSFSSVWCPALIRTLSHGQ